MATAGTPVPTAPPLQFEFTLDAAAHNAAALEKFDFDLDSFIRAHPGTTLSYGSELRPLDQLEPLLRHHPNFPRFSRWHTHGISYPVDDLDEETRQSMLKRSLTRGNHKSALEDEHRPVVTKLMTQDVKLG